MAEKKTAKKKKDGRAGRKMPKGTKGAPAGNQFWRMRSKHGRDKIFSSPEILWEAACEYFQWCDDNPWKKNEVCKTGLMAGLQVHSDTARPYTINGLCIFLDCSLETLLNYGRDENYNHKREPEENPENSCY